MMTNSSIVAPSMFLTHFKTIAMYDESLRTDMPLERNSPNASAYKAGSGSYSAKFLTKEEMVKSRHAEQQQLCDDGLLCCYDYLLVMSCE